MVCDLCKENEAVIFLEAIGKNGKRKIIKISTKHSIVWRWK